MRKQLERHLVALLAPVLALIATTEKAGAWTYNVENPREYSSHDCNMLANIDLPDYTTSLKNAMDSAGWNGYQFLDGQAWPQDLWESCGTSIQGGSGTGTVLGGLDNLYADNKNLLVFAGHGGQNWVIFDRTHNGECTANFTYHVRLGEMGGSQAAVAVMQSCSVLASIPQGLWQDVEWQGLRQQIGFTKEAAAGTDDLKNFFNATSTQSNKDAWINQHASSGWGAVVLTVSQTSASDCWTQHGGNKLKAGIGNASYGGGTCGVGFPSPQYLCTTYIN